MSASEEVDDTHICPHCGDEVDDRDLACDTCGEPLDDPSRGICGFCGVATSERCGGCSALLCWECSDGARTGADELHVGVPWCVDCRAGGVG